MITGRGECVASGVDRYDFPGRAVRLTCEVPAVREHFRSVYRHFLGQAALTDRDNEVTAAPAPLEIRIFDRRASSGEVLVDTGGPRHRVRWGGDLPDGPSDGPDALARIEDIVLSAISWGAGRHHLIRALSVSWRHQGIVLLGLSRQERTRLGAELPARGFGLLSDAVACFDLDRALLEAFPRQLASQAQPTTDRRMASVEGAPPSLLGAAASRRPRLFLFCQGLGEASRIHPVSAGRAAFRILKYSYGRCSDPAAALFDLAGIVDGATCLEVVVGESDDLSTVLRSLIQDLTKI